MQKDKKKNRDVIKKAKKRRITHEHHYDAFMIAGLLSFPFIAFIIAPLFHELFHVLVLEYYDCSYWTDFHTSIFKGLYAAVYPNCHLESNKLGLLYFSGVLGTLFIGFSLLVVDWYLTIKDYLEYSIFTSFIAMGFLFSPVVYFFLDEGDLINAFNILDIPAPHYLFPLIGIVIMFSSLIYFWYNLKYTSMKDLLEEEKEDLDRFGVKKTKKEEHKKYMPK
ncbi:MAG: hypothetical protein V1718_06170 [archaeon]